MASAWVEKLSKAQKTCMVQDGRRKIHFTFTDGNELSEEYDVRTNDLVVRKWKKRGALGGGGAAKWEFEIGEHLVPHNMEAEGLMESSVNPICVRSDTKTAFQWRIRNLPYPLEIYSTSCDDDQNIVIKTSNKKYYKKLKVPDMERAGLTLEESSVSIAHANKTLLVSYKKPSPILEMEKHLGEEFKKMKASKDGDVDCTPS